MEAAGRVPCNRAMVPELLAKYDQRVPRYTSYPTAPHFGPGVGAADYRRWLSDLDPDLPLSLYVHIPFCDSLCWFCGCHTKIVRRYAPVARYLDLLLGEIDMVADLLGSRRAACHVHLGGGTPTMLAPPDLARLLRRIRDRFDVTADADIAVEIDPRGLDPGAIDVLAACGVNRVSLGLQDVNAEVQLAINRVQPLDETRRVVEALRAAGLGAINVDLMYGLPYQTIERVRATIDAARTLAPDRISLFGYAHVPWMKRHQRLIDEAALPGADERFAQFAAAAERLGQGGYVRIGLDHFARPGDPLAKAARDGGLRRNFQGYTTDAAPVRLGFGPSAIGMLPQGYVQNEVAMPAYRSAVSAGHPPTTRGLRLTPDDRLRGAVIERLMCDLAVDLGAQCAQFGADPRVFAEDLDALREMEADGIVAVDGRSIRVTETGRPFVRTVCAAFDRYLRPDETRHARAV